LQQEGRIMIRFVTLKSLGIMTMLGAASLLSQGCQQSSSGLQADLLGPPAYSSAENASRQLRYAAYDWQQAIDDFDKNVTMTRPGSFMSTWNVSHSD
jgi:hypothetical protein